MFETRQTSAFEQWLNGLRDRVAAKRITQRILRLEIGAFGDVKFFDGIGELRCDFGPGYRVYFSRRDNKIILLLAGGDKDSQRRDVEMAKRLAAEWKE